MGHEMVKSCLGAYRHAVDPSLPLSDDRALHELLPGLANHDNIIQHLQDVENGDVHEDSRSWFDHSYHFDSFRHSFHDSFYVILPSLHFFFSCSSEASLCCLNWWMWRCLSLRSCATR